MSYASLTRFKIYSLFQKLRCAMSEAQAKYEGKIGELQAHAMELKDKIASQAGVTNIEMKDIERTVDDLRFENS